MGNKNKRLQELRGSDFEVAKGQPDIRGWEVRDQSGYLIGKVSELIFDSRAHKVRYMVVNVTDSKELQLEKRTVLVPIGMAVLQSKDNDVILENVTPFQLRALPKYTSDDLGTRAEMAISEVFGRKYTKGLSNDADADLSDEFYEHEQFNEKNMYRNREDEYTSSTLQRNSSAQSRNTISEAEAASLRRDTELNPHTTPETDTTSLRDRESPQQRGESDEDYIRRTGRND